MRRKIKRRSLNEMLMSATVKFETERTLTKKSEICEIYL